MAGYLEVDDTFHEVWRELESVKERLYLINKDNFDLDIIDRICNTVAESQKKVDELHMKYQIHFAVELEHESGWPAKWSGNDSK